MKDRPLCITSIFFLLAVFMFIIAVFTPLKGVFSPFITTLALIYFLNPAVRLLKRFKLNPVVAVLLIYALIIALFIFSVMFAIPKIYDAVYKIWEMVSSYSEELGIGRLKTDVFSGHAGQVYTTVMTVVKSALELLVGAVAAFYILTDTVKVKRNLAEFVPTAIKPSVKILCDDVKVCLDSFFKGQLLIAAILFLIDTVFLYVMGVPYAVGLGFIAAILDIVPYVGAFAGIGLIMIVALISVPEKILFVLTGLLIIQQIENNVITPKISADTLNIHPSVTVLVIYLGAFGGFWGILMSIPIACILRKICQRLIQSLI